MLKEELKKNLDALLKSVSSTSSRYVVVIVREFIVNSSQEYPRYPAINWTVRIGLEHEKTVDNSDG